MKEQIKKCIDEQSQTINLSKLIRTTDDLKQLQGITHITTLNLSKNGISDISVLASLVNLETLDISDNKIADISALESLKNLHTVHLENNNIRDIKPLSKIRSLSRLYLDNNIVTDISPLYHNKALKILSLSPQYLNYLPYWFAFLNKYKEIPRLTQDKILSKTDQIWQMMANGKENNVAEARAIALGQGWSDEDFELYHDFVK